jgi:predicted DCC family thiol-disulfide oxidoreductase YuxK
VAVGVGGAGVGDGVGGAVWVADGGGVKVASGVEVGVSDGGSVRVALAVWVALTDGDSDADGAGTGESVGAGGSVAVTVGAVVLVAGGCAGEPLSPQPARYSAAVTATTLSPKTTCVFTTSPASITVTNAVAEWKELPEAPSLRAYRKSLRFDCRRHESRVSSEAMAETLTTLPPHLVLYDGVCGLCDRTVQHLLEVDRRGLLHFAALQGSTAASLRRRHPEIPERLDSIVYVSTRDGRETIYVRAQAVYRICEAIGCESSLVRVGRRLPLWLNDLGYRAVAATRYRIFGKLDECRVPGPEERARFLP